jgi:hypothetical protein
MSSYLLSQVPKIPTKNYNRTEDVNRQSRKKTIFNKMLKDE